MIEKDLDKVLNYMKQYVEKKYEHDSEPMLNWKDLKLVLNEIERLHSIIKEVRESINKKLNVNSDYVDYDFGTELLRQELLEILEGGK